MRCAGRGAVLDDSADGLDARGARELLDLGELVVGVGALGQHREDEPALGLRARDPADVESSAAIMPAAASRIDALAERTLELVDIAVAVSRDEAALSRT